MVQECIARINELARIAKQRPLTQEEEAERAKLRKQYLQTFRAAFQAQLDNTLVQYDDGSRVKLADYKAKDDAR